ncbi:glycosyltransferase [Frankia sp. QA3]|uniref:glycosyltransferase n=1 Tax=Frankia sp. QA3 TaxID=710111 RepID=UPI000269CB0F|nr:glycosyltransferase [Frankia sp. QA3]EIV93297.1 glycosyltransferase [Frankia sp. QA3]
MKIATLVKTGDGPLWIIPHVLAAQESGDQVVVLLPAPDHTDSRVARELTALGIEVVESPAPRRGASPAGQLVGIVRLRARLRELGVDVVHYHLYASALAARLATLGTRITRVHMVAGPLYLDNTLIRRVERVLCRLDHLLIASSADIRQRYAALGLPAHRMRTLSYGVDLERFTPADDERRRAARAELGLAEDEFVAVCVAYFYPPKRLVHPGQGVKGHEVLLAAWARFAERGGRGTLILLGGGYGEAGESYRERVRAWAARLPGADRVRWVDSVTDVRPFYAAADVNVVSSWSESYGAGGEASACGVPTIATAAGGLPELVDDETGWLVGLGDAAAMAVALQEAAAGRRMPAARRRAAAARMRAEKLLDRRALSHDVVAALHDAARVRRAARRGRRRAPSPSAQPSSPARSDGRGLAGRVRSSPLAALPGRALRAARRTYLLRTDPVGYARSIGVRLGADCRFIEISAATFGSEPYLIRLGDRVAIAGGVRFITHDGAVTRMRREHPDIDVVAPIRVGNDTMIGLNAIIMPGVTIGSDVVIAAGSVVMRDVPARSLVAGAPARVVTDIEQWERRMLARSVGTGAMSPQRKREVFLDRFAAELAADPSDIVSVAN